MLTYVFTKDFLQWSCIHNCHDQIWNNLINFWSLSWKSDSKSESLNILSRKLRRSTPKIESNIYYNALVNQRDLITELLLLLSHFDSVFKNFTICWFTNWSSHSSFGRYCYLPSQSDSITELCLCKRLFQQVLLST